MPTWSDATGQGRPAERPADLLTRFLARLIDGVLVGVVVTLIVVTILFGTILDTDSGTPFGFESSIGSFFASVLTTALSIAYYAYFESTRGQTIGKMVMKTEVRDAQGGHPSVEVAVKRNLWLALSVIPFLGGLLQLVAVIAIAVTINSSRTGSGWHDEFAGGTRVVKV